MMKNRTIKYFNIDKGYSRIAQYYDKSIWQDFWEKNEKPIVQEWISSINPGEILDIGSGTGKYINNLTKSGFNITVIDINSKMLELNMEKNTNLKIKFIHSDFLNFNFETKFNYIISNRTLSHIKNLDLFIKKCSKLLIKNGEMFLSDIHPDHPYNDFGIKINNSKKIKIQTFKHSMIELEKKLQQNGLFVIKKNELLVSDSNLSLLNQKEKFYKSDCPLLYTLQLKKI